MSVDKISELLKKSVLDNQTRKLIKYAINKDGGTGSSLFGKEKTFADLMSESSDYPTLEECNDTTYATVSMNYSTEYPDTTFSSTMSLPVLPAVEKKPLRDSPRDEKRLKVFEKYSQKVGKEFLSPNQIINSFFKEDLNEYIQFVMEKYVNNEIELPSEGDIEDELGNIFSDCIDKAKEKIAPHVENFIIKTVNNEIADLSGNIHTFILSNVNESKHMDDIMKELDQSFENYSLRSSHVSEDIEYHFDDWFKPYIKEGIENLVKQYKENSLIVCIDNVGIESFEEGIEYEIVGVKDESIIFVEDMFGEKREVMKDRFQPKNSWKNCIELFC